MFALLLLLSIHYGWAAECSRFNGPEWGIDCRETYPGEYQWSTCVNATYVSVLSNDKVFCKYAARSKYCWLQCSIQKHYFKPSKLLPAVPEDCSCDPDAISPTSFLPSNCYSPAGDSCDWYRNCLEQSHPCEATTNAYAIAYAEKICKLYDDRKSEFSATGQKWIDGVRKCLQEALVPLLPPWSKSVTCLEIRQKALDSHTPCYLNPGKDVPSVCDLDCPEYFKIFFTIKGSFTKLDTAWKSLEGMWNIGTECAFSKCISDGFRKVRKGAKIVKEEFIRTFKIFVKIFLPKRKRRASHSKMELDNQSRFADAVGSAIASALDWNTEIMDWFAYPGAFRSDSKTSVSPDIIMVLADKKAMGIVQTSKSSVNFNQAAQELASAIEKGKLPLRVNGSNVWLVSLASCAGKSCNETQMLAISDKPPKWDVSSDGISCVNIWIRGYISVASLVMLINNLFLCTSVIF